MHCNNNHSRLMANVLMKSYHGKIYLVSRFGYNFPSYEIIIFSVEEIWSVNYATKIKNVTQKLYQRRQFPTVQVVDTFNFLLASFFFPYHYFVVLFLKL